MAEDVKIVIDADISPATRKFTQVRDAVNRLVTDAKALEKIQVNLNSVGITKSIDDIKEELNGLSVAAKNALTDTYAKTAVDQQVAQTKYLSTLRSNSMQAEADEATKQSKYLSQLRSNSLQAQADESTRLSIAAEKQRNQVAEDGAQFRADKTKLYLDRESKDRSNELARFKQDIVERNNVRIKGEQEYLKTLRKNSEEAHNRAIGLDDGLPRLRYALYDVANGAQMVSQALLGITTSVVSMASSYETAFTDVERTTNGTVGQLSVLKTGLLDLARQIPMTFQDISSIAAIGAQMGINTSALKEFTNTVAQFAAVTNVSIEAAAQSFGALGELLNVPTEDFKNLGSAIAYAGVKSNATESEILAVSTQLAGLAGTAKLTPQYVLGISTALASLRVPAEQSRGALTRVFQEINRSATTGEGLGTFAKVLGTTTAEAKTLASTDMGTFFNQFIAGLSKMNAQEVTASLDALNLSDVRVTNTLSRLAENTNVVADSMNNVDEAYQSGTFLADAYGKRVDDIAAKFQILTNIFNEVAAAAGSTLFGPLNFVLDILTWLGKALADIAKNPVGQALLAIGAVVVTIAGALAGLVSVVALGVAGFAAARTAFVGLAQAGLGVNSTIITTAASFFRVNMAAIAATEGVVAYTGATKAATAASNALSKAGPWMMAITAAISAIAIGWDLVAKANKSASDRATEYYGTNSAILDAAKTDTQEYFAGIQKESDIWRTAEIVPVKVTGAEEAANKLQEAGKAAAAAVGPVDALANSDNGLEKSVQGVNKALDTQTMYFGKNAKAAALKIIQDKILSDAENPLLKIYNDPAQKAALAESKVGFAEYTNAVLSGNQKEIKSIEDRMNARRNALQQEMLETANAMRAKGASENTIQDAIVPLQKEYDAMTAASDGMKKYKEDTIGLIPSQIELAGVINELNAVVDENKIATIFDGIEAKAKASNEFTDSLDALTSGLEKNGQGFDTMTSSGINNINNLNTAINSAISAAEALGIGATGTIGQVFANLQAQGVETAGLLQQVANMGGVQAEAAAAVSAAQAGTYGGLTSAYDAMKKGATGAGNAASGAAAKVRTLTDYANDLANVWKRAFDIRFSSITAMDKITSSWQNMRDAAKDADKEIKNINDDINSLNADIQGLTADRALQEYYLTIANAYGDALAADKARANLAKIDADITAKKDDLAQANTDLSDAQKKNSKTLIGNSAAAIANRSQIMGLVSDYQDYISSLAASGASQEELAAATAQAKTDFMEQATQLGYNSTELGVYASAFDDVSTAIGNVPRDITVTASTDPAIQALNELNAKANTATAARTMSIGTSVDYEAMARFARGAELVGKIATGITTIQRYEANGQHYAAAYAQEAVNRWTEQLNTGNFASGGYTGAGGKYEVAGIVHKGEYVIPKEQVNQNTGLPYFMSQMPKFFSGGSTGSVAASPSSMMVELSPTDRTLLAQAGNVQLSIDGRIIAGATNQNNLVSAQRGAS